MGTKLVLHEPPGPPHFVTNPIGEAVVVKQYGSPTFEKHEVARFDVSDWAHGRRYVCQACGAEVVEPFVHAKFHERVQHSERVSIFAQDYDTETEVITARTAAQVCN